MQCKLCERVVQQRSLPRHMKEVHSRNGRHRCRDCRMEFARSADSDRHARVCKVRQRRKAREEQAAAPARVRRVASISTEETTPAPVLPLPDDLFRDCPEWGALTFLEALELPSDQPEVPTPSSAPDPQEADPAPETLVQLVGEAQGAALPSPADIVAVVPPWDSSHPDHATFREQVEAAGWIMMPRAEYAAGLEQAAEAGERLRERLVRLAAPDSVPGIRPSQDAATQTSRPDDVQVFSERGGRAYTCTWGRR